MSVITRFAPSPTGHVHIGNMRSAIYSWLFARRHGGKFLLRLEDTDRRRSTADAVQTILDAMEWLGLTYDGEIEYQSRNLSAHLEIGEKLVERGLAYREEDGAVVFSIPYDTGHIGEVREKGEVERVLHPDIPVEIGRRVLFAPANNNRDEACLAGFKGLVLLDGNGKTLFSLDEHIADILAGAVISVPGARSMRFLRREVVFNDLVKGTMSKPLDGLKDLVIIRSDGTPVFHLANVCDDARMGVTHIIRGDDHVENTFRHVLLFRALGHAVPEYAHLPMVVNAQGKPYSKRDGAAFVGEFRERGYLGEALFNCLALLGWSPGGDREFMSCDEMVELFDLRKVKSSPAQFDPKKLLWLNGAYMAAMPPDKYEAEAEAALSRAGISGDECDRDYFRRVLSLMAERIKLKSDFASLTGFFFRDDYPYDDKAVAKRLLKPGVIENLDALKNMAAHISGFSAADLESGIRSLAEERGVKPADLIHPLRVSVSGLMEGPGLFEMLELLGRERVCRRIDRTIAEIKSRFVS